MTEPQAIRTATLTAARIKALQLRGGRSRSLHAPPPTARGTPSAVAGWRLENFNRMGGPVLVNDDYQGLPVAKSHAFVPGRPPAGPISHPPRRA